MKYKNFNEWFDDDPMQKRRNTGKWIKELMRDAWDAAVNNFPADTTKADIIEKQKVIAAAMAIQCTCDQEQIKHGYRCNCGKQKAVKESVIDLSQYIRSLK